MCIPDVQFACQPHRRVVLPPVFSTVVMWSCTCMITWRHLLSTCMSLHVQGFRIAGKQGIGIIAACQLVLMGGPEYAR